MLRWEKEKLARNRLRARLEKIYMTHMPTEVKDSVWKHSWDEGHAFGEREVEIHYEDYAVLAVTAYVAGRESILAELRNPK